MMNKLGRDSSIAPRGAQDEGDNARIVLKPEWRGLVNLRRRPKTYVQFKALADTVLLSEEGSGLREVPPNPSDHEQQVIDYRAQVYGDEDACVHAVRTSTGVIVLGHILTLGKMGKPAERLMGDDGAFLRRTEDDTLVGWNEYLCHACVLPRSALTLDPVTVDEGYPQVEELLRDLTMFQLVAERVREARLAGHVPPALAVAYFLQKHHVLSTYTDHLTAGLWKDMGMPYDFDIPADIRNFILPLVPMPSTPVPAPTSLMLGMVPATAGPNGGGAQERLNLWTRELLNLTDEGRLNRYNDHAFY